MSTKEEITQKVIASIDKIKPFLERDGGNIRFIELTDDYVVKVELQGACASCPHSIQTLKQGVEVTVKKDVPEIVSVEAINITC